MRVVLAILVALCAVSAAHANDSTAELATGGLVLTKNDAIEMRAEDLYISPHEIRVRYRFFNTSPRDITTLVAFPMPEIKFDHPDMNIAIPTSDPENILGFSTTVAGRKVTARVEQKVTADGVDHTDTLRKLGVPLAPHLQTTNAALDRLPRASRDELVRLKLAEMEEWDAGKGMEQHWVARWGLQTTYFWEQTFPAQRELEIEHRYQPSVGGTVQTPLGSRERAQADWFPGYMKKYCVEPDFLHSVDRATRAARMEFGTPFSEQRIDYILATGANWSGPIRDFRLVVDKLDPKNLVSFCGDGVKKISPTQFELRKTNFTPEGNFSVLILKPLPLQ